MFRFQLGPKWGFPKIGAPYFGVLIIRVPYFRKLPNNWNTGPLEDLPGLNDAIIGLLQRCA